MKTSRQLLTLNTHPMRNIMLNILVGFDAHFSGTCAYEGAPQSCKIRAGDFTDREELAAALAAEFPGATVTLV